MRGVRWFRRLRVVDEHCAGREHILRVLGLVAGERVSSRDVGFHEEEAGACGCGEGFQGAGVCGGCDLRACVCHDCCFG